MDICHQVAGCLVSTVLYGEQGGAANVYSSTLQCTLVYICTVLYTVQTVHTEPVPVTGSVSSSHLAHAPASQQLQHGEVIVRQEDGGWSATQTCPYNFTFQIRQLVSEI